MCHSIHFNFLTNFFVSISDVVIPTSSAEKSNIILKEGQKVMVLKSPKGIYMQLETGKIIAIRTALKVGQNKDKPVMQNSFPQKRIAAASPLKQITAAGIATTTGSTVGNTTTVTSTIASANKTQPNVVRQRNIVSHVNFGRNATNGKFQKFETCHKFAARKINQFISNLQRTKMCSWAQLDHTIQNHREKCHQNRRPPQ